ncbi:hypothetical protein ACULMA_04650 [Xanthomonas arboricola pv. corylina]|uniref:hypothetical protein n=1 Tax=Xanthomonas arboricola TaxID=56448 RepID=UPI004040C3CB
MAGGNTFNVRFEVSDDGKVSAHIAGIRQQARDAEPAVRSLGDRLSSVATIMGGALAGASGIVAAGMALVIRNTMNAERELAQLSAVLKSTGQDANFSAEQLAAMADSISRASTFSGGDITNAQTRLLSYSGVVTGNFVPALQVAIDQAARLGISVESSAEIVGRALESPTKAAGALAQQGFGAAFTKSVRDSIKALEQSGRTAEAQGIILDILNESYKGAAQAARNTFGGSLAALRNSLDDLMTGEGGSLDGAASAVNRLTGELQSEQTKAAFGQVITLVSQVTSELVGSITQLTSWYTKVREAQGLAGGSNPKQASTDALNARMGKVQAERSDLQRWKSNVFGLPLTDNQSEFREQQLASLEAERVAIQRELTSRYKQQAAPVAAPVQTEQRRPVPALIDEKEASRQAERIKRATAEMSDSLRTWHAELEQIGNPIIDEYNKRLVEVAERSETAAKAKVPTAQIDAFTASMRALAQQIRDRDIAEFQREFTEDTAEMAAQLSGGGASAALEYATALTKVQELLDAGVISTDQYASRQQALRDQMNAGAIQVLQDIGEEQQALLLNSQQLEVYNRLKQAGVDANTAYGQSIVQATEQLQRQRESAAVLGDIRSATQDFASDAIVSFGEAGDAAERWIDRMKRMAADLLADRAIQWLFSAGMKLIGGGATSYTGGGIGAGSTTGFGDNMEGFTGRSLFGFGGGRSVGGGVSRDRMYEVTEGGRPELLRQGNRTYLMPGSDGVVIPAGAAAAGGGGGGGSQVNVNIIGAPSEPQVTTRSNSAGGVDVEVLFKQMEGRLAGNMAAGNGPLYAATRSRLNVQDRR